MATDISLAAIPAIFPALRRPRILARHQPDAFPDGYFEKMQPQVEKAFAAMRELEAGAIANPDENRMVGHYWLREPELAPNDELRARHRGDERADPRNSPPIFTSARSRRRTASRSSTFSSSASAARRSGRSSSPTPSARRATRWTFTFSTTPTRTASTASSRRSVMNSRTRS